MREDGVHSSPPHVHRRLVPLPNAKRIRRSPTTAQDTEYGRIRAKTLALAHDKPISAPVLPCHYTTPLSAAQPLSRCHICHRKPTKKTDLDSFADCQSCGQRTCFVCIRQCADWRPLERKRWDGYGSESFQMEDADRRDLSTKLILDIDKISDGEAQTRDGGWAKGGAHRQVICSRCCVERGADGDVVCLGCLPFVDGL